MRLQLGLGFTEGRPLYRQIDFIVINEKKILQETIIISLDIRGDQRKLRGKRTLNKRLLKQGVKGEDSRGKINRYNSLTLD